MGCDLIIAMLENNNSHWRSEGKCRPEYDTFATMAKKKSLVFPIFSKKKKLHLYTIYLHFGTGINFARNFERRPSYHDLHLHPPRYVTYNNNVFLFKIQHL